MTGQPRPSRATALAVALAGGVAIVAYAGGLFLLARLTLAALLYTYYEVELPPVTVEVASAVAALAAGSWLVAAAVYLAQERRR